jgi:hypothetical protein
LFAAARKLSLELLRAFVTAWSDLMMNSGLSLGYEAFDEELTRLDLLVQDRKDPELAALYYDIAKQLFNANARHVRAQCSILRVMTHVALIPAPQQLEMIGMILESFQNSDRTFLTFGCCAELLDGHMLPDENIPEIATLILENGFQAQNDVDRCCVTACLIALVKRIGPEFHQALLERLDAFLAWSDEATTKLTTLLGSLILQLSRIGGIPRSWVITAIGAFPGKAPANYCDELAQQIMSLDMDEDDIQLAILQALARYFTKSPMFRQKCELTSELVQSMRVKFVELMSGGLITLAELLELLDPDEMNEWRLLQVLQGL